MIAQRQQWGLLAHPLIHWLFQMERPVYDACLAFIENRGADAIRVVLPPLLDGKDVELPVVFLRFAKIKRGKELGIQVQCSNDDLALIDSTRRISRLRSVNVK